jgi:hypothetical protein
VNAAGEHRQRHRDKQLSSFSYHDLLLTVKNEGMLPSCTPTSGAVSTG